MWPTTIARAWAFGENLVDLRRERLGLLRETAIPERTVDPRRQADERRLDASCRDRSVSSRLTCSLIAAHPSGATAGLMPPWTNMNPLIFTVTGSCRSQRPYSPSRPNA